MTNDAQAVDWGDANSSGIEPLPAEAVTNPLPAVFNGAKQLLGPKGPYFSCEYTLSDEAAEAHGNRKFWDNCSTAPGGLWHTKEVLVALGIGTERVSPGSDEQPGDLLAESVGQSVRLKLSPPKHYPKNDGTQGVHNEIDKVLAAAYAMP